GTLVEEIQDTPFQLRLAVSGPLDHEGSELLAKCFARALLADIRFVIVDVDAVQGLDHEGLKALVSLRAYALAAGVAYEVAHAPPLLRHVLALTALDSSDVDGIAGAGS